MPMAVEPKTPAAQHAAAGRILYAEDDQAIQAIAQVALGQVGGFDLRLCDTGQELLDTFADFAPDLVLLDFMMPGMDGLQTMRQLQRRADAHDIPIIFITARGQATNVNELMQAGALGVIQKPFDPMTLATRIRDMWNQHQASQQQSQQIFDNHIEQLRQLYVEQLPTLSEQLGEAWSGLQAGTGTSLINSAFHQLVHKLAGSAGMYGLHEVSQTAQQLEEIMQAQPDSSGFPPGSPPQSLVTAWQLLQTQLADAIGPMQNR